jgi:hypothetical protein
MLGLYVHVPFCSAICNYCNFNRGLFDGALKERYVEAVIREIASAGAEAVRHSGSGNGVAQASALRKPTRFISAAGRRRCSSRTRSARIIDACESAFDRRRRSRSHARGESRVRELSRGSRATGEPASTA